MKKILLIIVITFFIFQMVVLATEITIGQLAIDRPSAKDVSRVQVNMGIASEVSGTITTVEIWAYGTITNVKVATFFVVSGSNLSTRDWESIGTVVSGSKKTFSVNLDVEVGDYIGILGDGGDIEAHGSGYEGVWTDPDVGTIPCTDRYFQVFSGDAISLYGIGIGPTYNYFGYNSN